MSLLFPPHRIVEIANEVSARLRPGQAMNFYKACDTAFTALGIRDTQTRSWLAKQVSLELNARKSARQKKKRPASKRRHSRRMLTREEELQELKYLLEGDRALEDFVCGPLAANEHIVPID